MKKKEFNKLLLVIIISLFMTSLSACGTSSEVSEEVSAIPIEVEIVSLDTVERLFKSTGRIESSNAVKVAPELRGEIKNIHVSVGDDIKKGDVLFSLKSTDLQSQASLALVQARTNYELQIEKEKISLKKYEDLKTLHKSGAVSQEDFKDMGLQYEQSKKELNVARKSLESAKVAFTEVNKKFDIVSPIAGEVKDISGIVGQTSDESVYVIIQGDKGYEIKMAVPEKIIEDINHETTGKVELASSKIEVEGRVSKIGQDIDKALGLYKVVLKLDHSDSLKSGQFVHSTLVLESMENQIMVPTLAVLLENDKNYVYTYNSGQLRKKEVTIGLYKGEKVQIITGLKSDDLVVIKGQSFINEESVVTSNE